MKKIVTTQAASDFLPATQCSAVPTHNSSMRYAAGSLAVLSLALFSAHCSAQMYKCVNAAGESIFADKPCGPDAKPHVVKLVPASSGFDSSTTLHDEMDNLRNMPDPLKGASLAPNTGGVPENRQVVHAVVVERNRSTTAERNERIQERKQSVPNRTPN